MKKFTISLMTVCLLSFSSPLHSAPQTPDELKRISTMIIQGKADTEVLKAWEVMVKKYPKIDIDKTINTIISTAKEEKKKSISGGASRKEAETTLTNLSKQMHENAKRTLANLKS